MIESHILHAIEQTGPSLDKVPLIIKSYVEIQSTLVISNSKGISEILRDIRTSTGQTKTLNFPLNSADC